METEWEVCWDAPVQEVKVVQAELEQLAPAQQKPQVRFWAHSWALELEAHQQVQVQEGKTREAVEAHHHHHCYLPPLPLAPECP